MLFFVRCGCFCEANKRDRVKFVRDLELSSRRRRRWQGGQVEWRALPLAQKLHVAEAVFAPQIWMFFGEYVRFRRNLTDAREFVRMADAAGVAM